MTTVRPAAIGRPELGDLVPGSPADVVVLDDSLGVERTLISGREAFGIVILMCRALLFDMDGVLINSTAHVDRVWRRWAKERDVDPEAVLAIAHGRRTEEVLASVARRTWRPLKRSRCSKVRDEQDHAGDGPVSGSSFAPRIPPLRTVMQSLPPARPSWRGRGWPTPACRTLRPSCPRTTSLKGSRRPRATSQERLSWVWLRPTASCSKTRHPASKQAMQRGCASWAWRPPIRGTICVALTPWLRDLSDVSVEVVGDELRVELKEGA